MLFDKTELIALIGAMASVVGILWRMHVAQTKREQQRLERCESLHRQSQDQVVELTGEYRELKGRMDGVEKLSRAVLDKIETRRSAFSIKEG